MNFRSLFYDMVLSGVSFTEEGFCNKS